MSVVATAQQPSAPLFHEVDIITVVKSDTGTAQMEYIGVGANTREYALKDPTDEEPYIHAVELFCYELCRLLDIPKPEYDVVRMPCGRRTFGSLWNGAAVSAGAELQRIIMQGKDSNFFDMIGRIYGTDLFIGNIDRHANNYLIAPNKTATSILAMDFGRALFNVSYNGYEAADPKYATRQNQNFFAQHNLHRHIIAGQMLDKILQINPSHIEQIFTKMPNEWLPTILKQEFLAWWGTDEFVSRIEELKSRGLTL